MPVKPIAKRIKGKIKVLNPLPAVSNTRSNEESIQLMWLGNCQHQMLYSIFSYYFSTQMFSRSTYINIIDMGMLPMALNDGLDSNQYPDSGGEGKKEQIGSLHGMLFPRAHYKMRLPYIAHIPFKSFKAIRLQNKTSTDYYRWGREMMHKSHRCTPAGGDSLCLC